MTRKLMYLLLALCVVAVGVYVILYGGDSSTGGLPGFPSDIPDPYYVGLKSGDVPNPDDIIRYGSSIRGYASNLDVFEKAAFYEWYFKNHGFETVNFAYTDNFDGRGISHLWLLMRTPKGEVIEVEPSYKEMDCSSMVPLDSEYTKYDKEFDGILEACRYLGANKLDWWNDENARQAMEDNVLLAKKKEAMRAASSK